MISSYSVIAKSHLNVTRIEEISLQKRRVLFFFCVFFSQTEVSARQAQSTSHLRGEELLSS